jgi:hypothetical protein
MPVVLRRGLDGVLSGRGLDGVLSGRGLDGVLSGGGGVGASGWGVPDQDTGFGLFQPPALGLLAAVMVTAQRGQVAFARATALLVRVGVVEVAAGGAAAAPGCSAGGVAGLDPVGQFAAGPVAVFGPVVLARPADDGGELGDVQQVQQTAWSDGSG